MNDTTVIHDIAWLVAWDGTKRVTFRHADPPFTC